MKALPGFELRAIGGGQQSDLIDPSGQPRTRIDGAVLEAVHELEDGYLIVSSDGDAFEDCMHVTLCDRSFARREVIHVGGAYQTGSFRSREIGPGPRLQFSYFSDECWRLDVLPPRWRLRLPRPSVRHEPGFRPGRLWLVREAQPGG